MNINDVAAPIDRPEDLLSAIFDRQHELMVKYHHIEEKNGLLQTPDFPVDLHDKFGQARLKDFAWRMTEEFTEATDGLKVDGDPGHYFEELIDGLHFMIELFLIAGYRPEGTLHEWFVNVPQNENARVYDVIERIGCAMNCLKNKPWKTSHMLTDSSKFMAYLEEAWSKFIIMMISEGLTPEDVYDLYFRKSEVNKFRQRSNY